MIAETLLLLAGTYLLGGLVFAIPFVLVGVGTVAVELVVRDLARPDVLVYWATGKETGRLPDDARLLGALSSHAPLPIPADLRGATGRLVLYSLADHEIVGVSKAFLVEQ